MNSALIFSEKLKRGKRPLSFDPKQILACHYDSSARFLGTLRTVSLNALFIHLCEPLNVNWHQIMAAQFPNMVKSFNLKWAVP